MKKFLNFIAFLFVLIPFSFSQKTPLTPELVVKGGFLEFKVVPQPEKIIGNIQFKNIKENIINNFKTFIFINKYEYSESGNRLIFSVNNIPVGSDYITTPVGTFLKSKSEISFLMIIDITDSSYNYQIKEIKTNRSIERIEIENIAQTPQLDIDNLKNVGFNIENISFVGIDLPTKGDFYSVHKQRIAGMIANRNGYVNRCIKEAKTLNKLKTSWIENINEMDQNIQSENQLLQDEYNAVLDFVKNMNIKILED
jgi:hypothetical protein